MKLTKRTLCTSLTALAAMTFAALAGAAPQEIRLEEFQKRFAQAASISDHDEMAKLVRLFQTEAVIRTDVICTQIAQGTSEELEKQIDLLNKAWKASMKTNFVENHYAYLSLISPPTYRERERLRKSHQTQTAKYFENLTGKKDGPTFALAAGATDNGGPGYSDYWPGYYAAFVYDPDGHNIEAVWYDYEKAD